MTFKEIKKLMRDMRINQRVNALNDFAVGYASARSVVDDRQPFFKQSGKLLTVKQKMSLLAH